MTMNYNLKLHSVLLFLNAYYRDKIFHANNYKILLCIKRYHPLSYILLETVIRSMIYKNIHHGPDDCFRGNV